MYLKNESEMKHLETKKERIFNMRTTLMEMLRAVLQVEEKRLQMKTERRNKSANLNM